MSSNWKGKIWEMAYIVTSWKFLFLGIRGDSSGILGDGAVDERRGAGGFSPITCAMGEACREPGAGREGPHLSSVLPGGFGVHRECCHVCSPGMLSCMFARDSASTSTLGGIKTVGVGIPRYDITGVFLSM